MTAAAEGCEHGCSEVTGVLAPPGARFCSAACAECEMPGGAPCSDECRARKAEDAARAREAPALTVDLTPVWWSRQDPERMGRFVAAIIAHRRPDGHGPKIELITLTRGRLIAVARDWGDEDTRAIREAAR